MLLGRICESSNLAHKIVSVVGNGFEFYLLPLSSGAEMPSPIQISSSQASISPSSLLSAAAADEPSAAQWQTQKCQVQSFNRLASMTSFA